MAETTLNSFEDITGRMDEIITAVRSKDTSLERSLDLFDEAIELGSHAVELVDSFDLSPSEAEQLEAASQADEEVRAEDEGASEGSATVEEEHSADEQSQ